MESDRERCDAMALGSLVWTFPDLRGPDDKAEAARMSVTSIIATIEQIQRNGFLLKIRKPGVAYSSGSHHGDCDVFPRLKMEAVRVRDKLVGISLSSL